MHGKKCWHTSNQMVLTKITWTGQITGVVALHILQIPDAQLVHTKETLLKRSELKRWQFMSHVTMFLMWLITDQPLEFVIILIGVSMTSKLVDLREALLLLQWALPCGMDLILTLDTASITTWLLSFPILLIKLVFLTFQLIHLSFINWVWHQDQWTVSRFLKIWSKCSLRRKFLNGLSFLITQIFLTYIS